MRTFRAYNQLRSFVTVARRQNMSAAAEELNVTRGAVSHQVQRLEEDLGFPVFRRRGRSLALNEAGQRLLAVAESAFDDIEREVAALRGGSEQRITIGMATYFASRWLSPRLMNFITEHPRIGLRLQPLVDLTDLDANGLDMAVRWGKGEWSDDGLQIERIFRCPAMLTTSIELGRRIEAEGPGPVLAGCRLLRDRVGSMAWRDWFDAAGLPFTEGADDLVIPDPNVRVQAVIDGQGVGLYDVLVKDELEAGKLYQFDSVRLEEYGYFLVSPRAAGPGSPAMTFRDWIMDEARHWA